MQLNKPLLAAGLLFSLTSLNAEASLTAYNAAGNTPVVYSSVSDITWTGDANLLGTMISSQGFNAVVNAIIAASPVIVDTPNYLDGSYGNHDGDNGRPYSGQYSLSAADFASTGQTNWFGAQAFVGYLNSIHYAGSNQWTLPSASANPQSGYNPTGNQLGQLFYSELGGTADSNIANLSYTYTYWLATEYAPSPNLAWLLYIGGGLYQYPLDKTNLLFAWAVSPGQVAAVPVPGAFWLFGTGLVGLLGLKRRGHAGCRLFG